MKDTPETSVEIKQTMKEQNMIFTCVTEDGFLLSVKHLELFTNAKQLVVMRHPIEAIFS